jgi:leucyl-tRNA synthetase
VFVRLLCPFAPHLCEEIWEQIGGQGLCSLAEWPSFEETKTVDETIDIAVQINGKTKTVISIPFNCQAQEALSIAKADEKIAAALNGKTVIKEIFVPNKILNLVVKN